MPQELWLGCVGGTYDEAIATWEEEEEEEKLPKVGWAVAGRVVIKRSLYIIYIF